MNFISVLQEHHEKLIHVFGYRFSRLGRCGLWMGPCCNFFFAKSDSRENGLQILFAYVQTIENTTEGKLDSDISTEASLYVYSVRSYCIVLVPPGTCKTYIL